MLRLGVRGIVRGRCTSIHPSHRTHLLPAANRRPRPGQLVTWAARPIGGRAAAQGAGVTVTSKQEAGRGQGEGRGEEQARGKEQGGKESKEQGQGRSEAGVTRSQRTRRSGREEGDQGSEGGGEDGGLGGLPHEEPEPGQAARGEPPPHPIFHPVSDFYMFSLIFPDGLM